MANEENIEDRKTKLVPVHGDPLKRDRITGWREIAGGEPPSVDEMPLVGVEGRLSKTPPEVSVKEDETKEGLEEGVGTFTSRTEAGMRKVEERKEKIAENREDEDI